MKSNLVVFGSLLDSNINFKKHAMHVHGLPPWQL